MFFLFAAAWVGGVLNTVAGGGGLIVFPALLFVGLPPIQANATATCASWPGHIAGIAAYRKELQTQRRLLWWFGGIGVLGGWLGALLLLHIPTGMFAKFLPFLMLFSTLVFACSGAVGFDIHRRLPPVCGAHSSLKCNST
ncbi:MAG: sulfite exporter TauE/SafE family protein [Aphanocapsa lilacina HA4352-LM1]|jgi:uncharacterized membrane protein YfcA|nr:sulfite exporter TauE/SafE family protein [Aphanocapsa lilacina HA4352-LM1]